MFAKDQPPIKAVFLCFMAENQSTLYIQSGDQNYNGSWDPHIKLRGLAKSHPGQPVQHLFHLADGLGRDSNFRSDIHVAGESYQFRDGKEVQPSWFAVADALPALPLLAIKPSTLADHIGTKFATFAQSAGEIFAHMPNEERQALNKALHEMGYPLYIPTSTESMYYQLTRSNWTGLTDAGEKSASSLTFDETVEAQRKLYAGLYHQTAQLLPRGRARDGVRERLDSLVGQKSRLYQVAKGKTLPEAARAIFAAVSPQIDKISGVKAEHVTLEETTDNFRLPKSGEKRPEDEAERFRFADWYLQPQNRELYTRAHNEVWEELSKRKGENPIQSLPKGEAPLWVIIDGEKYKLHLHPDKVTITHRKNGTMLEEVVPVNPSVSNHEDLAQALYKMHPKKDISLMPTAIGLMLHLRANGDVALPEQGSHYTEQVNMVWERMEELAIPHQLDAIAQHDILRVHPHALQALPDNVKLQLPWHMVDGFPVDKNGLTNTSDIKRSWSEVVARKKQILQQADGVTNLTEKAQLLFYDKHAPFVDNLVQTLSTTGKQEEELKKRMGQLGGEIRAVAQKEDLKYLGQVSAYARGDVATLEVPESLLQGKKAELESIRQDYLALKTALQQQPMNEMVLKYLVMLRVRELHAGIEALEYYDARPSLMTIYALFGDEGVKRVIHTAKTYTEKTPHAVHKEAYNAEGNKILVVNDPHDRLHKSPRFLATVAQNLRDLGYDTAMVLTPATNPKADFAVSVVEKDGSVSAMCGNGTRAVGRYGHEYLGKDRVNLQTKSGEVVVGYKHGDSYAARLSEVVDLQPDTVHRFAMHPSLAAKPVDGLRDLAQLDSRFHIQGVRQILGEPHMLVTTVPGVDIVSLTQAAQQLAKLKTPSGELVFPEGVNVNFMSQSEDGPRLLTYERGVDNFTGSCGTGSACAASLIFEKTGESSISFTENDGGLRVHFQDGHYHLSGSVTREDLVQ